MLEYIKFGGKSRPYSFGYKCLKNTLKAQTEADAQGLDLDEVMLYWAFVIGAKAEKIDVDFDNSDIENWIDADLDIYHKLRGDGAYHFMQFEMKDKQIKIEQATKMTDMLESLGVDLNNQPPKSKKKISHSTKN